MKAFLLLLCIGLYGFGQTKNQIVYVNNSDNVFLFFDDPIKQGHPGHSNFAFAFDLEEQNNFGIVKGKKGTQSNLHVITANGNVYTFVLKFKESLDKFNYFFNSENDALGNINGPVIVPGDKEVEIPPQPESLNEVKTFDIVSHYPDSTQTHLKNDTTDENEFLYDSDRNEYFRKRCYYNQGKRPNLIRFLSRSGRVYLQINSIYYDRNELYFFMEIKNRESIDYDLNFVRFSIAMDHKGNSSNQATDILPLYTYRVPSSIGGGQSNHFVMVFQKFTLDDKKKVVVELNEINGNRNIYLKIDHRTINEANSF